MDVINDREKLLTHVFTETIIQRHTSGSNFAMIYLFIVYLMIL
jgi:hypothetical protein